MHGQGTFHDARLEDAARFPIAAANDFGDVNAKPDLVTSKLADLHLYQLALEVPVPPADSFDAALATEGQALFDGKAKCATCHVPPLFTEPGWNLHTPEEIGIDAFQAERSPEGKYRTTPLRGLFTRAKGGFYHDGRFATLADVVDHYDAHFATALTADEKTKLVEYRSRSEAWPHLTSARLAPWPRVRRPQAASRCAALAGGRVSCTVGFRDQRHSAQARIVDARSWADDPSHDGSRARAMAGYLAVIVLFAAAMISAIARLDVLTATQVAHIKATEKGSPSPSGSAGPASSSCRTAGATSCRVTRRCASSSPPRATSSTATSKRSWWRGCRRTVPRALPQ